MTTGSGWAGQIRADTVQALSDNVAPGALRIYVLYPEFVYKRERRVGFLYSVALRFDVSRTPARFREKRWGPESAQAIAKRMTVLSTNIAHRWNVEPSLVADVGLVGWEFIDRGDWDDAEMERFFRDIMDETLRLDLMEHVVRQGSRGK